MNKDNESRRGQDTPLRMELSAVDCEGSPGPRRPRDSETAGTHHACRQGAPICEVFEGGLGI
jgi:hypothetical protein